MKDNDPLISVQGQSQNQSSRPSHLSTGQNEGERPSRLSTRSVWKSIFTTLSSQYKVKIKDNDPLVQYKVSPKINLDDPLVSVQGQNEG